MTAASRVEVSVDLDRCQGHGKCYHLAPEMFDPLDDLGHAQVIGPRHPTDPALIDAAELAAINCPERAIAVVAGERTSSPHANHDGAQHGR